MSKKFSGLLICSDLDGTLRNGNRTEYAFRKNAEAIEYFKQNGGRFTIITGRLRGFLPEEGLLRLVNAPVGLLNGAEVYDYAAARPLHSTWLGHTVAELARLAHGVEIEGIQAVFKPTECESLLSVAALERMPCATPMKLVYSLPNEEIMKKFKSKLRKNETLADCFLSSSWSKSIEVNRADSTKAHNALFIKKYTGCDAVYAIGDYENDIPMIKAADVGAAVGGSPANVIAAADKVTCRCEEGAVAELIYSL